jgi:hypothetical protein
VTQIHLWRSLNSPSASAVRYIGPVSGGTWDASATLGRSPAPIAFSFRNLSVVLASAPTAGRSLAFEIMVNGVASGLVVTIADGATTGQNTAVSAPVVAGDTISLRCTPSGTPTVSAVAVALESETTTLYASHYGGCGVQGGVSITRTNGALWPQDDPNWNGDENWVSANGTVTDLRVQVSVGPTSPATWTFVLLKNGVAQDGTGGTPNTTILIEDPATTGVSAFSLPVIQGDELRLRATPSGSPAVMDPSFGLGFSATQPGVHMLGASQGDTLPAAGTEYNPLCGTLDSPNMPWDATETIRRVFAGVRGFTLQWLMVNLNGALGAGTSSRFRVVVDGTPTDLGVVLADGVQVKAWDTAHAVAVLPGQALSFEYAVLTGTPATREARWSFLVSAGRSPFMTRLSSNPRRLL